MSPELDPRRQTPGVSQGQPTAPAGDSGNLTTSVPPPVQAVGGALPPPPPADAPGVDTPASSARERKDATPAQLDFIKALKADPQAREQWYERLDAAVKSHEIRLPAVIKTLKTEPDKLSASAANLLLNFAPILNPEEPATASQLTAVKSAYNHVLNSDGLAARCKDELPDLFEKLEAGQALTKGEASAFIELENTYKREMATRPATERQIEAAKVMLKANPKLADRMSPAWHGYLEQGRLTNAGYQRLADASFAIQKEDNQAALQEVLPTLLQMNPEQLQSVIDGFMPRFEEKLGDRMKDSLAEAVTRQIHTIVDPTALEEARQKANDYLTKYDNALLLRDVVNAMAPAEA